MAAESSHMLRTEKPITFIAFNMTFMWTFHTNSLSGYIMGSCLYLNNCVHLHKLFGTRFLQRFSADEGPQIQSPWLHWTWLLCVIHTNWHIDVDIFIHIYVNIFIQIKFYCAFLRFCCKFSMKIIFYLPVNTDNPKNVPFFVFVCTTTLLIAQISAFENVSQRDAVLAPVAKQWIIKDIPSYESKSKRPKIAIHWFGKY